MNRSPLIALALALLAPAAFGQAPSAPAAAKTPAQAPAREPAAVPPKVTEAALANGMRILLVEKHDSPTIAFHVMFKVGSVDEEQGQTGLAHMFEHMIFNGTKRLYTRDWNKEKPILDEIEKAAQALLAEQEKGPRAD